MSTFGTKNVSLDLPEDIEKRLVEVQENISILEGQIINTTNEIENKKLELDAINSRIENANIELNRKIVEGDKLIEELTEREQRLIQKESALDVYANALKEKEQKINKYLEVFEKMKEVVKKS